MRGSWCALIGCAFLLVGAQPASGQLVALGDSYSSGEGAPPFEPAADRVARKCHRSTRAWPMLVARRLRAPGRLLACSGARIPGLVELQVPRLEADAPALGARLVTLTIGGNDAGFSRVLIACGSIRFSCDEHFKKPGDDNLDAKVAGLRRRLPGVYQRVTRAMPVGARLVVAGYPRLFPREPGPSTCAVFDLIDPDEATELNAWAAKLNEAVRAAAGEAGVEYVDVTEALAGHEMSCEREQWLNAVEFGTAFSNWFHPNVLGQRALAEVVGPAVGAAPRPLVRVDGIGPLRIGMTRAEVAAAWPGLSGCDGDPQVVFAGDRLVGFATSSRGALSDRMVALGDDAGLVRRAYRRIEPLGRSDADRRFAAYGVRGPESSLVVLMEEGAVAGFIGRAGRQFRLARSVC